MSGEAAPPTGGGWTCPVCFFYCQRDWLICPVCDYIRPADLPMDGEGEPFCVVAAAQLLRK